MAPLEQLPAHSKGVDAFQGFVGLDGRRLRQVLVVRYGVEMGTEAAASALAYAWEHWDRVEPMDNRLGYLYRVAQTAVRNHRRWGRRIDLPAERGGATPTFEPQLHQALAALPWRQRVAVLVVHGYGWTYAETAAALGVPVTTVRNDLHRGLKRLRRHLGEGES